MTRNHYPSRTCRHFFSVFLFAALLLPTHLIGATFNRDILAVYNDEDDQFLMHELMEMVVNHYGLKLIYHNAEKPPPKNPKDYRALLFWPTLNEFNQAELWLKYMAKAHEVGTKLLILGNFPGQHDSRSGNFLPEHLDLIETLGFKKERFSIKNPLITEARRLDPNLIDFESRFEHRGTSFPIVYSKRATHQIALQIGEKTTRRRSDLVVTGSFGGLALKSATYRQHRFTGLKEWILNPFLFIEKALELGNHPIPDISTVNGFRGIYCHIDGDGFEGICRFNPDKLVSEAIFDDVLTHFKFPHTFSLVHSWFDTEVDELEMDTVEDQVVSKTSKIKVTPQFQGRLVSAAKRIFSPPWVEYGLHGYGHPLYWGSGQLAIRVPGRPFSVEDEILTSQRIFTDLIGKPAEIFLWTGDCKPGTDALSLTVSSNLLSINGGDSLFDEFHDSYTNVAPLYRQVGPYHQVYTSHTNENIYTNNWTGPFYGFRNVIESFKNTESPRRISPINIYYHWFCGELKASLKALEEVFQWAHTQSLTPIRTTDYVRSVQGFINTKIEGSLQGWDVTNRKGLRTLRLNEDGRNPKVGKDYGILGYRKENNLLYIHLDNSSSSKIRWATELEPHLVSANCIINKWELTDEELKIDLWGYRPATITMAGLPKMKNISPEGDLGLIKIHVNPQGDTELVLPLAQKP